MYNHLHINAHFPCTCTYTPVLLTKWDRTVHFICSHFLTDHFSQLGSAPWGAARGCGPHAWPHRPGLIPGSQPQGLSWRGGMGRRRLALSVGGRGTA